MTIGQNLQKRVGNRTNFQSGGLVGGYWSRIFTPKNVVGGFLIQNCHIPGDGTNLRESGKRRRIEFNWVDDRECNAFFNQSVDNAGALSLSLACSPNTSLGAQFR
jgi:hypothetical protein